MDEIHINQCKCINITLDYITCKNTPYSPEEKLDRMINLISDFKMFIDMHSEKYGDIDAILNKWCGGISVDNIESLYSKIVELDPNNPDHDFIKMIFVDYWVANL